MLVTQANKRNDKRNRAGSLSEKMGGGHGKIEKRSRGVHLEK